MRGLEELLRQGFRFLNLNREMKRASLALDPFALHPEISAHKLGQAFADDQPQSGASIVSCGGTVQLAECMEQAIHAIQWDSDAGISNGEMQDAQWRLSRARVCDGNLDFASLREFDRVAQEVEENLSEAGFIANDTGG